jgi:hypothetical protein
MVFMIYYGAPISDPARCVLSFDAGSETGAPI